MFFSFHDCHNVLPVVSIELVQKDLLLAVLLWYRMYIDSEDTVVSWVADSQ